ncbi:hypothetical protein [Leucobacter chinensis]|uniref:hypothetical protein n=1 Tax=Leucobacter chinensis TaxID=2851010 RepID=UPI001C24A5F9|nr:hypothetical protein [Leucobacter chinensis]
MTKQDTPTQWFQVGRVKLPHFLYDGYLIHQTALSLDLDLLLLPRQVMLAGKELESEQRISFAHGVPNSSSLPAVIFAQDRRLRRALFERSSVPKPKGATFTWRSRTRAAKWAKKIGYPVTVKEMVGENPATTIKNIRSSEELRQALEMLRRRDAADRAPGSNPLISAYAATKLAFDFDENGNEVAPLSTRFLVEKQLSGLIFRAFVLQGEIVSIVELDPDSEIPLRNAKKLVSSSTREVILKAASAIPDLSCATVEVVVKQKGIFKKPATRVTSLSERPRMDSFILPDTTLPAENIAKALVNFEADSVGLELEAPRQVINKSIFVEGLRHPQIAQTELPFIFEEHGATFNVESVDSVHGTLTARCSGPSTLLAALMELLMSGDLLNDRATAVEYTKDNKNA